MEVPECFVIIYQYSRYLGSHKHLSYTVDYHPGLLPYILTSLPYLCNRLPEVSNVLFNSAIEGGCLSVAQILLLLIFCCFLCDFTVSSSAFLSPSSNNLLSAASAWHWYTQMWACLIPGFSNYPPPSSLSSFTEHFSWLFFVLTDDHSLFSVTSFLLFSRLQIDFGHRIVTELKTKDAS